MMKEVETGRMHFEGGGKDHRLGNTGVRHPRVKAARKLLLHKETALPTPGF